MDIYDEIDKIREILEYEIDKSSSLSDNKILELSVRLDKLINEYYRSINYKGYVLVIILWRNLIE